jgi:hypothetical protein
MSIVRIILLRSITGCYNYGSHEATCSLEELQEYLLEYNAV